MYALFLGHLALPAFGVPFDSAAIVSTFADFPEWAKIASKTIVALPASFHTFNGLRHLSWDAGYRAFFRLPSCLVWEERELMGFGGCSP